MYFLASRTSFNYLILVQTKVCLIVKMTIHIWITLVLSLFMNEFQVHTSYLTCNSQFFRISLILHL